MNRTPVRSVVAHVGVALLTVALASALVVAAPWSASAVTTFDADGDYLYSYDPDDPGAGATITGYTGADTVLVLPDTVTFGLVDYSVTAIGDSAFFGLPSLTSLTIPDTVLTIDDYAFYQATGLTSLTIGDSVTTIGRFAFASASSLTSLTIPDSVVSIAPYAFIGADSLTSLDLGASLTTISERSFASLRSLTSLTIPDSVVTIGSFAFFNALDVTSLTIGNSVTTIGDSAFSQYGSLTSVTIPDSVTTIGPYAFFWSDNLASVTIPDSVTTIGPRAFMDTALTSVNIPASVTSIGDSAFDADSLTAVAMQGPEPTTFGTRPFGDGGAGGPLVSFYGRYSGYTVPTWDVGGQSYRSQALGTVLFDSGIGASDSTEDGIIGGTIAAPATPSAEAHRFLGWFDAAAAGAPVTFPLTVTADTTVFSQWEARVVVSPAVGHPDETITVTGSGFEPGESVSMRLDPGAIPLGAVTASGTGTINATVLIDIGTAAGAYQVVLDASVTGSTSHDITISLVLAATGSDPWPLAGVSLLLILVGAGLLASSRRLLQTA